MQATLDAFRDANPDVPVVDVIPYPLIIFVVLAVLAAWLMSRPYGKSLIAAGDNPERVRGETAWAKLCGVAPIPASSGMTTRHRLNRGGHRHANAAIYRTVIVRMRHHDATRAYVARRTADGRTKAEIIRCLKCYVAREIWALLKRSDEKWITERAYENPKFVEDLVRDVALRLNADPRVGRYTVDVENFESIHNHSAYARIERA